MTTKSSTKTASTKFAQKQFHIGIINPLNAKRNVDILLKAVEPLCELGFTLSVLAVGDKESQAKCFELSQSYLESFELLESIPSNKKSIFSRSQVICFTSQPDEKTLKELAKKGIVPIMPEGSHKDFQNFSAQTESGNAFLFDPENFWEFLATIIRAYENYKFPYDWNTLKKNLKKTGEEL